MSRLKVVAEPSSAGSCSTKGFQTAPVEESPSVLAPSDFAGNVALVTLGCAKNLVDSEVMLGVLSQRGFRPVDDPETADLIVVNTCAFLQSAVEEGIDRILELAEFKKSGRCRRLVVAGCMVERYRDELTKTLPEVDRFVSTDELLTIADEGSTTAAAVDGARRPYFIYDESMPRIQSTAGHTAFLKVAEGCNRPCTFCIIPKIRGEYRSRSIDSVSNEGEMLLSRGVRELNLVAQDLTAYGCDFPGNRGVISELPKLLRRLAKLSTPLPYWVRLLYAYPVGVTEELIQLIRSEPALCNYLDLPLQHISNGVLKAMRRPLGERNTRALIEQIRTIAPEIALRTTFIVGFPGETEEDVLALRDFVREGHFTNVGVFPYSQESESVAYHFDGQIDEEEREARRALIMEAQQQVLAERFSDVVGRKMTVLIEGTHEESDLLLVGRTEWQAPETDGVVILNDVAEELRAEDESFTHLSGKFATVEITEVAGYDLVATVLSVENETGTSS